MTAVLRLWAARSVACSLCGAKPGARCGAGEGAERPEWSRRAAHAAREQRWLESAACDACGGVPHQTREGVWAVACGGTRPGTHVHTLCGDCCRSTSEVRVARGFDVRWDGAAATAFCLTTPEGRAAWAVDPVGRFLWPDHAAEVVAEVTGGP